MKRAVVTLGTIAALMTSTAAMASNQEMSASGPRGTQAVVQTTDGMSEVTSTKGDAAGPSTDYRTSGVREETVYPGDAANASGPRGAEADMTPATGTTVLIVPAEPATDPAPGTNGPRGVAETAPQTDGVTTYSATEAEPAGPSTDYRADGVREESVFPGGAPQGNANGPRGS